MIISRTPHRISFFGGGTDYPSYYLQYGGKVIGAAIDKYCYLSVRKLPPFFNHKHRIVYSRQELIDRIEDIEHPSVRETLKFLGVDYGVSVHHDGDIPARSGMGSSSAFTVGLLNSMHALEGRRISRRELMERAIYIEQDLIGECVGSQDQAFAAYGGLNAIEFHPTGQISVSPIIIKEERLRSFQNHLLLFYTGVSRIASEVAQEQVGRTAQNVPALQAMGKMVDQAIDILCSERPLTEFGELLEEGWRLKQSLSSRISTCEVDDLYTRAKAAGALGGKLLGAGGGGFMLLFVEPALRQTVKKALQDYLYVPFGFDSDGSKIIVYRPDSLNGGS
ncbi:MAG: kinase [Desulfuromonadaceae bacterium]|nr:kinase [Desulfuromonadaceae bacterium]